MQSSSSIIMDHPHNNHLATTFLKHFNHQPAFMVSAPGRINLIGEHTDYSEGFVLPVAINRNVTIAFNPREDNLVRAYSVDFDEQSEINLASLDENLTGWMNYIAGMAWVMQDAGYHVSGWDGVISGSIPIGAGLSSSAALEVAAGKVFCVVSDIDLTPRKLALLAQKAEWEWVGVNVGIMDQLISSAGKEKHAMLLDCRSLDYDFIPIPEDISLIVLDTLTRRELTHSAYNTRHEEVRAASEILGVKYLRDANIELLNMKLSQLTGSLYQRAKHVITENERVLQFIKAMRSADLTQMGALINASHASLRDDYEVSSEALNLIVAQAQEHPHCLGARMMGAGFGGCALAIISNRNESSFTKAIHTAYQEKTGLAPHIFSVQSANGVTQVGY